MVDNEQHPEHQELALAMSTWTGRLDCTVSANSKGMVTSDLMSSCPRYLGSLESSSQCLCTTSGSAQGYIRANYGQELLGEDLRTSSGI